MIRRDWMWAVTVVVAAGLLPGCRTGRSDLRNNSADEALLPAKGQIADRQATPARDSSYDRRELTESETPAIIRTGAQPGSLTQPPPPSAPDVLPPQLQQLPRTANPPPTPAIVKTPPPAPRAEPLLTALSDYRQQKPTKALEALRPYDPATRELLSLLLPLVVRVSDFRPDKERPSELALALNRIDALTQGLRPKAALRAEKSCFCRSIRAFGDYEPLPDAHVFCYGDLVEVYVELRNLTARRNGRRYETVLTRTIEIYDYQQGRSIGANKQVRPPVLIRLPVQVNRSWSPRQDWFVNCRFSVPSHLPVGRYYLKIIVQDVTNLPRGVEVPQDRTVELTNIPFHVAPRGTGLVSTGASDPQ